MKRKMPYVLAGVLGFEPRDGGTKNRCLTAWLYPNTLVKLAKIPGNSSQKLEKSLF
jgi:hypothetical protein